jgi:hypothetical protein
MFTKEDRVSWFFSGLVPDDLVGYGDVEEALDALISAGASTLPGAAPAADSCRDAARTTLEGTCARLLGVDPPREDVPVRN